jgi:hypothetical protein
MVNLDDDQKVKLELSENFDAGATMTATMARPTSTSVFSTGASRIRTSIFMYYNKISFKSANGYQI